MRTEISPNLAAAISQNKEVAKQVRRAAAAIRDEARRRAPKDTGAGARSIKVQRSFDRSSRGVSYHVSWDKQHYYMGFQELGTVNRPARPFLRPAADAIQRGGGTAPSDSDTEE